MNQYLGREKVPFDPDANQFDPVPAGMYFVRVEAVNTKEIDTKYGKAKVLNPQHRILMGDEKGKSVWGSVFVYTADDNPGVDFSGNLWVNNGYFDFVRNIQAMEPAVLETMIEGKEMPLLTEDELVGHFGWIVVEHRKYWKKEVPPEERTEKNQETQAFVKNWIATDIGCQVMHVEPETLEGIQAEAESIPF